jgi:hypothetical protein
MSTRVSTRGFGGVRVAQSLVFYVVFDRSLFFPLPLLIWPVHYLSIIDLRVLITPLASSNCLYYNCRLLDHKRNSI